MNGSDLCEQLRAIADGLARAGESKPWPVTDYQGLVRQERWRQAWDGARRAIGQIHEVTGRIWSDAIERCLEEHGSVFIPRMDEPVCLDRPVVLEGGYRLIVHPQTEIRLKPGAQGTCLVRNSNVVFSQSGPVDFGAGADAGILIEGGIWSDQNNEGRGRGGAFDQKNTMPGSHGAFLLHNVSGITVRNVRFRDCSAFAIQLGNAVDFLIENITFDATADGIHIEGPSARGVIRHIAGKTNDAVALNAWDWDNSSITFGPINYLPGEGEMAPYLVSVGPKSLTWTVDKAPGWKEIFHPNANPVLKRVEIKGVYVPAHGKPGAQIPCKDVARLVDERPLSLNPDFPRTMPRGGTGRGRVDEIVVG